MSEPTTERQDAPRRSGRTVDGVLVVLALALVCGCVLLGLRWRDLREEQADASDAVARARQQVLGLTTLDEAHIESQLQELRSRTTGEFQRQFDGIAETFVSVVRKDHIIAEGKVMDAGLVLLDTDRAIVVVASSARVRNGVGAQATERSYRMRVQLEQVDDEWLVSGMEFVS